MPSHNLPSSPDSWLSTAAFAGVAGISERKAQRALSRALDGKPWRGHLLTVRTVASRGGVRGMAHEVLADSLPVAQDNLRAPIASPAPPSPKNPSTAADPTAAWRYEVIRPILPHPPRSAERRRAVAEATKAVRVHPSGRRAAVSKATIYRWLDAYEEVGFAGLKRPPRANRRKRLRVVSRAWDEAVEGSLDEATMARIAADLERYTASVWGNTTEVGARWVARLASNHLQDLTVEAGFAADKRRLRLACKLPVQFVQRFSEYRVVAVYDKDRKKWNDKHRPRIERTREGCKPMEIVVCDVHPMDVLLPRADGSTFTAKLVCFQDWANNRVFVHPVFLEKGKGVRQAHVVEAIIAMVEKWGVPETFYLDNGSEYGCVELATAALTLVAEWRAIVGGTPPSEHWRPIVKALPYNPEAKAIEGLFAVLEGGVFSFMPGWVGGDRMKKKTANLGREPVPYPHGGERFLADLRTCIDGYETKPQDGVLKGLSPRDAYRAAVDAGWRRMDIEPNALRAAFARDGSATVRKGRFTYKSESYTSRKLQELPSGTALHILIPISGGLEQLPVLDDDGELFCMAVLDRAYDALDPEGARESGRRLAAARAGVAELRSEIDELDMMDELGRVVSNEDPAPVPESAGVIRLDEGMEAIGREMKRTPAKRRADEDEQDRISRERWRESADLFLEKTRAAG